MKTTGYVAALVALTALVTSFSSLTLGAGQNGNSHGQRGGQAATQVSGKGGARNGAQWFADPERGWVRADERRDGPEKTRPSNGAKAKTKKSK